MNSRKFFVTLAALLMLGNAGFATAAYEHKADRAAEAPEKAASAAKGIAASKAAIAANHKAAAKIKRIDINSASKATLKKLPGLTDQDAEKIIANRPYGSKAWLVTNRVIDPKTYGSIKTLIEAKQPYKTAEKNAALYQKLAEKNR
jgi:DNA uptake protein ComE-like DNA-binding protein